MELFAALFAAISPFLVKGMTNLFKKSTNVEFSNYSKVILRFVVALLALGAAWVTSLLDGGSIDVSLIEQLVQAFYVFLGATGLYFWEKKRKGTL